MGSALLASWRLRRPAEHADVLHAWSPAAARAGRELALATGKALVASVAAVEPGEATLRLKEMVGPGLMTLTVSTRASRRSLLAAGLPEGFVHVLPPPARPPADRRARRARVRRALGVGEEVVVASAPDPMVRAAGHYLASWAHAVVRQVIQGVALLLPGTGRNWPHVRCFARTTGYEGEVFLTERRFSRRAVLAASDVALFLHVRPSGVGALAGAMAAGLPIAAARTPEIAECAPDGEAALLVEPGDPLAASAALLRLAEDAPLARRLGSAARRRAREAFAPAASRRKLGEVYAAALEARLC
jgi:hypothetical protein